MSRSEPVVGAVPVGPAPPATACVPVAMRWGSEDPGLAAAEPAERPPPLDAVRAWAAEAFEPGTGDKDGSAIAGARPVANGDGGHPRKAWWRSLSRREHAVAGFEEDAGVRSPGTGGAAGTDVFEVT